MPCGTSWFIDYLLWLKIRPCFSENSIEKTLHYTYLTVKLILSCICGNRVDLVLDDGDRSKENFDLNHGFTKISSSRPSY